MDDSNSVKDHMIALEDFVQQSILAIDNSSTNNAHSVLTDFIEQVQNLKEEDDRSLEDLKENIKGLQNTLETTKQHLGSLEKKFEVFKKDKENLEEQKSMKKKHLARVKKQHESQEDTVLRLQKHIQKDSESHLILDRNKKELLLYKQMTGISWDYKAPQNIVAGYVTNKETCFLKSFSFNRDKMSSRQITEALWDIIAASSLKCSNTS